MKPILFIGDSHLARLKVAYEDLDLGNADFFTTPGPIAKLVDFADSKLIVHEDREMLTEDPRAKEFDFIRWLEIAIRELERIGRGKGVHLDDYSSVVIVSYQHFNPEIWCEAALAHARGEISSQVWDKHCQGSYDLDYTGNLSDHCRLLAKLANISNKAKIFSVATPARSAAAPYPQNLLRTGESGLQAFRSAEAKYAELVQRTYDAENIPYPDSLMSADGLCTSERFQQSEGDRTHVNVEGSKIWLAHILDYIRES